jgi:hypothetical protein
MVHSRPEVISKKMKKERKETQIGMKKLNWRKWREIKEREIKKERKGV